MSSSSCRPVSVEKTLNLSSCSKVSGVATTLGGVRTLRSSHAHISFCSSRLGRHIDFLPELAICYGSDCSKIALITHLQRNINPNVKSILDARGRGDDTKNVIMIEGVRHGNPGKG